MRLIPTVVCSVALIWAVLYFGGVSAQEKTTPTQPEPPHFRNEIEPLFAAHCIKCHGPEKQQGGLRLDRKASALTGGDSGERAIAPGHAAESRLFQLVTSADDDERMPPEGEPLSAAE